MLRAPRLVLALLLLATPLRAEAPPAPPAEPHPEVLIVVNERSPASLAIGELYRSARGIPAENVVRISIPPANPQASEPPESIPRPVFEDRVLLPVRAWLEEHGLVDRIEVIVTTRGVPLVVHDAKVEPRLLLREARSASVTAELALLFSNQIGSPGVTRSVNPYLGVATPFRDWPGRGKPLKYLVAHLDGYPEPADESHVPADVRGLVERARQRGAPGVFLIDSDPEISVGLDAGNTLLLRPAAAALRALGLPVVEEATAEQASNVEGIRGLATWGSNASVAIKKPGPPFFGRIEGRLYPGVFAPRALTVSLVSTDARSFSTPPRYGQSLAADLVRLGAAGAAAHALEPSLAGVARPYLLLREHALGAKAVEAYFRSIPFLGWTNVYIGDPLMVPQEPVPQRSADQDGDGVPDVADDCRDIPNADQRDTDGDGFGNLCDADIDGDGLVTTSWGLIQHPGDIEQIAITAQKYGYVADQDLDGDGKVNARDVSLAQVWAFQRPGPGAAKSAKAPP